MFGTFLLAFIPLFVAMDPIGLVPMYLSLSANAEPAQRRAVIVQALSTAPVHLDPHPRPRRRAADRSHSSVA